MGSNNDSPDSNDPQGNDLNIPSNPQVNNEESYQGSMPNPDKVDEEDTLEEAQDMGLYQNADDEHPAELNVAQEVQSAEDQHQEND